MRPIHIINSLLTSIGLRPRQLDLVGDNVVQLRGPGYGQNLDRASAEELLHRSFQQNSYPAEIELGPGLFASRNTGGGLTLNTTSGSRLYIAPDEIDKLLDYIAKWP